MHERICDKFKGLSSNSLNLLTHILHLAVGWGDTVEKSQRQYVPVEFLQQKIYGKKTEPILMDLGLGAQR
jgi:hypothetical protein